MSGSRGYRASREPLLPPEVARWADEQWSDLTDDQAVAELAAILAAPHGGWDGYVRGRDGKTYPSHDEHPAVLTAHILTAHLLGRGIGLRDLARKVGRSHATVRRWALAARRLTILKGETAG